MREALAGANHDFLLRDDDRRETQRGRGAKAGAKSKKGALTKLFGGRRRGIVFLCLAGATAIGVPLNALYFQDGRHPAPLFRSFAPEPHAQAEAQAPLPPVRPQAAAPTQAAAVQPAPAPHAPVMAKPQAAKPEPTRAEKRDTIGALLGKDAHKEAPKTDEADKNVLSAQRALAKLGFALRPDGKMGGATKQAIEKFERDNHLPVTGEVTAKLLRKLQGQASVGQANAGHASAGHASAAAH
ncbi:peptidoglycan-binding protein [Methylosinus sp. H3A]|uniref:peptidoglycan-binding domain-containing protein n=1 Tax=Methylosinus sp. H3A TaxID=2785786 RepID=UPI0018C33692|nr:peptidoglycan-binding domain-containing protein [Methylosinus sp. H3A]MBG0809194.1 peptidoglycan-binding protein [Methylosinus sp. H3A]